MRKWEIAKNAIMKHIDDQKLQPGDPLPSDRELAKMLRFSLQPVIRAMRFLADQGLIDRRAGAKTIFRARQPRLVDNQNYSFSFRATQIYGCELCNKVLEKTRRLPQDLEEIDERAAQKALGLKRNQPFYVIARLRYLDNVPRVIHRSYLNPAHFPETFLADHEFDQVSLMSLFEKHGYQIENRETNLRARFPTATEKKFLKVAQEPILSAEQVLTARTKDGTLLKLEFMSACYVNWVYSISNRL